MMQDTIRSKRGGYSVKRCRHYNPDEELLLVCDGTEPRFTAIEAPFDFFKEESADNECFNFCEAFTARDGRRWIYWRDEEADIDYLTPIADRNKMRYRHE